MPAADDIAKIIEQERVLVFSVFDEAAAFDLGMALRQRALRDALPINIDIRLWDRPLFYAAMPGSRASNQDWARRKINAVRHFLKPSYRLFLEQGGKDQVIAAHHGLPATDYIFAGGAFPIRVHAAGVIGAVAVSGLPSRDDHDTVVAALCELLGSDSAALALGPA
ncbi:heme-degrading domain-containing protein [Mesorhizobium sp. J428]|uniref:heme-degrading domain-containing protein n=1 Tax=Mesorhizobium sp. J428 TaxID=2898440 RepID=UPI002150C587|nr:heme-degrading domain-containing protein [Mesorhizobium sp. J428]MCR5856130.1 heme-degrading domain-containing protein [Mesorhizobium sp. J428]